MTAAQIELGADVDAVILDGAEVTAALIRDVLARLAVGNETQDAAFGRRQGR